MAENVCMMLRIVWIPAYAGMTVARGAINSQALRVRFQYLLRSITSSQHAQDVFDHDAGAPDAGFAATDVGVYRYSLVHIHSLRACVRMFP